MHTRIFGAIAGITSKAFTFAVVSFYIADDMLSTDLPPRPSGLMRPNVS